MSRRRWVLWQGLVEPSFERLILSESDAGFVLSGLILQAHEELAYLVRYTVQLDRNWQASEARIDLENGTARRLVLTRTRENGWHVDGQHKPELDACIDVDLEWTPSTNTLPIRRLSLVPGASTAVYAAWVRFPALTVQPLAQSYERVADWRYRYRAGTFVADLAVDRDGLVTQYGDSWRAAAHSGWSVGFP